MKGGNEASSFFICLPRRSNDPLNNGPETTLLFLGSPRGGEGGREVSPYFLRRTSVTDSTGYSRVIYRDSVDAGEERVGADLRMEINRRSSSARLSPRSCNKPEQGGKDAEAEINRATCRKDSAHRQERISFNPDASDYGLPSLCLF